MKYIARILVGILLMLSALFCLGVTFTGIGGLPLFIIASILALAGLCVGILGGYFLMGIDDDQGNQSKDN